MPKSVNRDVIIIGAGASGLMCALQASRRGRQVLVLDHAEQAGTKIRISGGGHSNFTNLDVSAANYVSANPHFCKSALTRFPSTSFIRMLEDHGIEYEKRKHGQLFCSGSATLLVRMLENECLQNGVEFQFGCKIEGIEHEQKSSSERFTLKTSSGIKKCHSLVIATGGLSIPKSGATGFGLDVARHFGLSIIETAPALDGFVWSDRESALQELAGITVDCVVSCGSASFRENLLFTHQGLSGPAALQASLYWRPGDQLRIDFVPDIDVFGSLMSKKRKGNRGLVKNLLGEYLPSRLAEHLYALRLKSDSPPLALPNVSEKALEAFCRELHDWKITPSGTVGYSKAEVMRGGVDTNELSSKTMESKKVPGLYFIGEVVDVTGWLGGYNLQWAWSSGWAAGQAV